MENETHILKTLYDLPLNHLHHLHFSAPTLGLNLYSFPKTNIFVYFATQKRRFQEKEVKSRRLKLDMKIRQTEP